MAATEVLRFRVTPDEKNYLRERSEELGLTMSDLIRMELGLSEHTRTPVEELNHILLLAQESQKMSGLTPLTEDEVIAFVDAVRAERQDEAVAHA